MSSYLHAVTDLLPTWVPRVQCASGDFYDSLCTTNSTPELKKLLKNAPSSIRDYVRVVKNHHLPLAYFQEVVDDYRVPVLQLQRLRSQDVDPNGIYLIECIVQSSGLYPDEAPKHITTQLSLFHETRNLIAFSIRQYVVNKPKYLVADWQQTTQEFVKTVNKLTNSFVLIDPSTIHTTLTLGDMTIAAPTTVSFTHLTHLELVRCSIATEIELVHPEELETFILEDCPAITTESTKPLMETALKQISVRWFDPDLKEERDPAIKRFNTFPVMRTYHKRQTSEEPHIYSLKDITINQQFPLFQSHFVHRLKNLTFTGRDLAQGRSSQYVYLRVSTIPANYLQSPRKFIRPVIDGLSLREEDSLGFKLTVCGLFPLITNFNVSQVDDLEIIQGGLGNDSTIFEDFGPQIYGSLFSSVKKLTWDADPKQLQKIDGIFNQLGWVLLRVRTQEDFDAIGDMKFGESMRVIILHCHMAVPRLPLPDAPSLTKFVVWLHDRVDPLTVTGVSLKYPKIVDFSIRHHLKDLKSFQSRSQYGYEFSSPVIWEDPGPWNKLLSLEIMDTFIGDELNTASFPVLDNAGLTLLPEYVSTVKLNAPSLKILSLAVSSAGSEETLKFHIEGYERLTSLTVHGTTLAEYNSVQVSPSCEVVIDNCPSLEKFMATKGTWLTKLVFNGSYNDTIDARYYSPSRLAVHECADGVNLNAEVVGRVYQRVESWYGGEYCLD